MNMPFSSNSVSRLVLHPNTEKYTTVFDNFCNICFFLMQSLLGCLNKIIFYLFFFAMFF